MSPHRQPAALHLYGGEVNDEVVQYRNVDGCAVVTMHRPPANALGEALIAGLDAAVDRILADGARAAVIRSAVPGFFAAGADLKLLRTFDAAGFLHYLSSLRTVLERIAEAPVVTVAAIEGHALGGGLELAMACSLRVASRQAGLGVPEVRLGLLPGAGGTQRLPRLVGRGPALDLLLTGRPASGEEAFRLGLVDRLVDDGEGKAEAAAMELAHSFAQGPRLAHAAILRCVDAARDTPLEVGMRLERDEVVGLFETADATEGIAAFIEKRPAGFRGT